MCAATLLFLLVFALTSHSQQSGAPPAGGTGQPKSATDVPASAARGPAIEPEVFGEAAVNNVLSTIRDGLLAHNPSRLLSAFDPARFGDYRRFSSSIHAFFGRYESFRVHFRIGQSWGEGQRGIAIADFEMEMNDRDRAAPPVRRRARMRLEIERGAKGWKIVGFTPQTFFS